MTNGCQLGNKFETCREYFCLSLFWGSRCIKASSRFRFKSTFIEKLRSKVLKPEPRYFPRKMSWTVLAKDFVMSGDKSICYEGYLFVVSMNFNHSLDGCCRLTS